MKVVLAMTNSAGEWRIAPCRAGGLARMANLQLQKQLSSSGESESRRRRWLEESAARIRIFLAPANSPRGLFTDIFA